MASDQLIRRSTSSILTIKVLLIMISIIQTYGEAISLASEYTAIYLLNLTKISTLAGNSSLIITSLS